MKTLMTNSLELRNAVHKSLLNRARCVILPQARSKAFMYLQVVMCPNVCKARQ